jgi:GNAT superfamily N-acetyltransferase
LITVKQIKTDSLSDGTLNRMYAVLIRAYAETEVEVWGENHIRISKTDFIALIKCGEIFGAFIDSQLVGSVRLFKKDPQTFSFGLLSADLNMQGKGIGNTLVSYIETRAKQKGAVYMDIEILRAVTLEPPFKKRLKEWYIKLGYTYTQSGSFLELKPYHADKAKKLIQPCVFDCYQKILS